MENLSGKYDTLACIDVMIHYPTDKVIERVLSLSYYLVILYFPFQCVDVRNC